MKFKRTIPFIIYPVLLLASCEFNLETLRVTGCTPSKGAAGITYDTAVEISFSNGVNRADAEALFKLEHCDEAIEGRFTWTSDSSFTFTPVSVLDKNGRYVVTVPRSIRDSHGNTMGSDFISDFYIGSDFTSPVVTGSTPAYAAGGTTGVPVTQNITVEFSKSMNRGKTESSFSLSPGTPGYFQWSEALPGLADSRLTFVLTGPMEYGKLYKLKVGGDAEDSAGNKTGTDYMVYFVTGDDFEEPFVTGMYCAGSALDAASLNTGISKTGSIRIDFSENMDRQSVEKSISITPATGIYFDWHSDQSLNIQAPDTLEPETVYRLVVDRSCTDLNGHALTSVYGVDFITSAPDSLLVKTGMVTGSYNNTDPWTVFGPAWPVDIDMGTDGTGRYFICVEFLSSAGTVMPGGMDHYSIFDNCMLETFSATSGDQPHADACITDIYWIDDGLDNRAVVVISSMTRLSSGDMPALYRLTLAGGKSGIRDSSGNYMKEDYIVEFREEQ